MYEYNKIYGQAKKLQTKEALEALQSLLFTFNYNGLNLIKNNTKDELNLYNDLVSKLDLNEEGFTKFWSKKDNIVSLIKKSLASTGNIKLLQQLKSFMSGTVIKAQPKQKQTVKEGQSKEQLPFIVRPDTELEGEEEGEGEEPEEDYGELINSIAEELPTIIVLEEIDTLIRNIHEGNIERHKNITTLIHNKSTYNTFMDDMILYRNVIIIMTSNEDKSSIDAIDPCYLRSGRIQGNYSMPEALL